MRRGRTRRAKKVSWRRLLRFYLPSPIPVLDGDRRREADRPSRGDREHVRRSWRNTKHNMETEQRCKSVLDSYHNRVTILVSLKRQQTWLTASNLCTNVAETAIQCRSEDLNRWKLQAICLVISARELSRTLWTPNMFSCCLRLAWAYNPPR